MLGMIFLAGADKRRYGKLIDSLNNSYLTNMDNYPSDVNSTVTLLSHYQDHQQSLGIRMHDNNGPMETSFAQFQKCKKKTRIHCFKCNKFGHIQKDCPRSQNHFQQGDESNDNEAGSVASIALALATEVQYSRCHVEHFTYLTCMLFLMMDDCSGIIDFFV